TALAALLVATGCGGQANPPGSGDGGLPTGDGRPACVVAWECASGRQPAGSDQGTRTCTDKNNVGTTVCKPSEGPVALPALDFNYYQCNVEPILDRGCAMMGCHGTERGRQLRLYARGRLRNDQTVN